MTTYSINDRWQENRNAWRDYWKDFTIEKFATWLIIIALVIVIFGYFNQHGSVVNWTNILGDFYANVSSELLSIVLTVAILNRLNERRQDEKELTRLKALLGSNENVVTKIALAELRAKGWLRDGSLRGAKLAGANLESAYLRDVMLHEGLLNGSHLEGADLMFAELKGTDFILAHLENAQLGWANLAGANLIDAHLEGAVLSEAILPDGTRWDKDEDMKRFTDVKHPKFEYTCEQIDKIREKLGFDSMYFSSLIPDVMQ